MKTYLFLLNFGYAESSSLGFIPFKSDKKFASTKAAFINLAEFLKEKYVGEDPVLKSCCIKAVTDELKFCGKCGRSTAPKKFNSNGYIEFVQGIDGANIDSYASDIADSDCEARWEPVSIEEAFVNPKSTKIIYVAEKCLAAAIGHSPDDRVTIESIFKSHRKTDSFSFWG